MACEKQQVSVLAEHLDQVLDEVQAGVLATVRSAGIARRGIRSLDAPINEDSRRHMTIAWDRAFTASSSSCSPTSMSRGSASTAGHRRGVDEIEADEVIVVKLTLVRAGLRGSRPALVAAGRPSCPFCLQPMDPHTFARGPTSTAVR